MLTNKRRPCRSQLYSTEACRVRNLVKGFVADGLGWEDICRELDRQYRIKADRKQLRRMVLDWSTLSETLNDQTPNCSAPSNLSSDASASTISLSLPQPCER